MRINVHDKEKIQSELNKVQKKAKARTLDADDVLGFSENCEKHLMKFSSRKSLKGSRAKFREAVECNSYKYRAEATYVILERGSSDWFMVECGRSQTATTRGSRSSWMVPSKSAQEDAQKNIVKRMHFGDPISSECYGMSKSMGLIDA